MVERLLHITDLQKGFAFKKPGELYVSEGENTVPIAHEILDEAPSGFFPLTIDTYDTHPWFSYYSSMECTNGQFPLIHCGYRTEGWELAFDPSRIWDRSLVLFMPKNVFDVWSNAATPNVEASNRLVEDPHELQRVIAPFKSASGLFLPSTCLRDEFYEAVHWNSENGQKPFNGKIIVQGVDYNLLEKSQEGFYIVNPGTPRMTVMALTTREQVLAFRNNFHGTTDPMALKPGTPRDFIMLQNHVGPETVVYLLGLASNFCVDDAILGYLELGCEVRVIEEGVRGIPLPEEVGRLLGRAHTGNIRDVVRLDKYRDYAAAGKLKIVGMDDVRRDFKNFRGPGQDAPEPGPA
jgi:hypothetical protein